MGDGRLRVITGEVAPVVETRDPQRFQAECVEAFVASWTARRFAESTIANDVGVLERMLAALGRPAWEVTAEDVDRVVGELASSGRAVSTRRNYLQVFTGFHRFLEVRKAAEIEAAFGVRLACPLDEFNAARHVSDDSPSTEAPPTPERVAGFFEFLKHRIATARKYAPAARDYAVFRTLYHAGLRSEEVVMLEPLGCAFRAQRVVAARGRNDAGGLLGLRFCHPGAEDQPGDPGECCRGKKCARKGCIHRSPFPAPNSGAASHPILPARCLTCQRAVAAAQLRTDRHPRGRDTPPTGPRLPRGQLHRHPRRQLIRRLLRRQAFRERSARSPQAGRTS